MAAPRLRLLLVALAIAVVIGPFSAFARECLREDFEGAYTPCVEGLRNLIYYKKPTSDCTGNANQPENLFNIPCDITCPSGQYLPLGSTNEAACTPCPTGKYSLGGGVRIEGSGWIENSRGWAAVSSAQLNFRTSCTNGRTGMPANPSECSKWKILGGTFGYSGTTSDNHISILEATATFVRNGTIAFEYRVDAERGFDYLTFEVDEEPKLERISQQLSYTRVSFPVTVGTHVFRWKYIKDFSLSYGDDTAFLRLIEVTGTSFADSECTPCSAGMFADRLGSSSCTSCPANTKAPQQGSAQCQACGVDEYSFVGATRCLPSQPCQQSDVVSYYSSCFANNTRSQYYYYQTPKICSERLPGAYIKPDDRYDLECAPCSPGWERNTQTGACQSCPTNTYSKGTGDSCAPCPSGHAGRRDFIWNHFEELPSPAIPATMGCIGDCGTQGWRLGTGYIDSGVGHAAYSDVFFSLNLTTVSEDQITFNLSFHCNRLCYLSYTDHDITGTNASDPVLVMTRTVYSFFYAPGTTFSHHVNMKPGAHMVTFHFSKFDGTSEAINDQARIHGIQVRSVAQTQGGAAACQPCVAGQFVSADEPYCKLTPPGTFTGPLATSPSLCPADTYAEFAGSAACAPCGAGTTAPRGSTWCDESCAWRMNSDISYDLKALSRVGGDMYGPIIDPITRRNYFLNICTREHTNTTCHDDEGDPISTQACMADTWGFGLDIGRVTNFYPHPRNPERGLTIVYKNATSDDLIPCRFTPPGQIFPVTVPRTTNITLNCDPFAGFGTPEFLQEGSNLCTYNFVWNTLFACPACDDSDWTYYYSECTNGRQFKTYQWKDNPKKCHGGQPLPAPVERTCSVESQTPCPAGTYLFEECTDCPNGTFSLGGGKIFNYFPYGSALDPVFIPSHPNAEHPAANFVHPQGPFLEIKLPSHSAVQSTSLAVEFNWVQAGDISFHWSAITGNGYSVVFSHDRMEGTQSLSSSPTPVPLTVNVPTGTHLFRFTLSKTRFASSEFVGWLRIYNVTTSGTSRAAAQCTPSLPGTFVSSPSKVPNNCPANTFQPMGKQTTCDPVPANRWAPVGSERHYPLLTCSYQDYDTRPVSGCADGRMTFDMIARQPSTCVSPLPPRISAPCTCAPGTYRDPSGICRECRAGEGWDAALQRCVTPTRGSAAVKVWSLVKGRVSLDLQQSKKRGADATYRTTCHGTCLRQWALTMTEQNGPMLESGLQVGYSVSALHITVPMSQAGVLSVSYRRTAAINTQTHILVDGVVKHADDRREATGLAIIPVFGGGERVISIVQYANEEVLSNSALRITDLTVSGAAIGASVVQRCPAGWYSGDGATTCTPCEPGKFSSTQGSSSCDVCPVDTYSAFPRSTGCSACGPYSNTDAKTGATLCSPTCTYTKSDGTIVDWNDLATATVKMSRDQRIQGFPEMDVNLCAGLPSGCSPQPGRTSGSFSCATFPDAAPGYKTNYGTKLSTVSPTSAGLELLFTSGDTCLGTDFSNRTTRVNLICPSRSSDSQSAPTLQTFSDCLAELTWVTNSACRACGPSDYRKVLGECKGRKQIVAYLLQSDGCHHNNNTQPASTVQPCSQIGVSVGLLVGIGIAIVLLVVSLAVFCLRHRKLTTQYRLLKEAHDGTFEDHETQFGVDDEDGVSLDKVIGSHEDDDDGLRLPTSQSSHENPQDEL